MPQCGKAPPIADQPSKSVARPGVEVGRAAGKHPLPETATGRSRDDHDVAIAVYRRHRVANDATAKRLNGAERTASRPGHVTQVAASAAEEDEDVAVCPDDGFRPGSDTAARERPGAERPAGRLAEPEVIRGAAPEHRDLCANRDRR
jgi:hypothetical protein